MRKLLLIAFKDIRLAFRDRTALILMLLAPFLLTVGMGAVTGRFSGGSSGGISNIPVILINQDGRELGNALVDLFQSDELGELIAPTVGGDPQAAYQKVDRDEAVAVVLIPAGFTASIIPDAANSSSQSQEGAAAPVQILLYTNPTTPTSAGVVKTIVDAFLTEVEAGRVGGEVAVRQLIASGRIRPEQAQEMGAEIGSSQAGAAGQSTSITLKNITPNGQAVKFDVLALLAPGMALMFLMYTVSNGGRTLLNERSQGTLPRLLVSPTTSAQVLGGKMLGIYLTGLIQMLLLIYGTSVLFGVAWGDYDAVQALVMAAVFAAVGWGMLITAIARTPGQVSAIGSAIMLTFGILGGTFINLNSMPAWFRALTKITPNAWGAEGFTTLALGGTLQDVLVPILALLVMGAVLFAIALLLFNRRGLAER